MAEPNLLFHEETFRVGGYDVDLHKVASIPSMIQMMHEAAMQHVLHLGLSALELAPLNLGWVLIRQQMHVFRQPGLGEIIRVHTRPSGRDRAFAYRDFRVLDEAGSLLATATTAWLLMDTQTRRMARYPEFIQSWLDKTEAQDHLPRPVADFPPLTEPGLEKTFLVNWHDLDFNHHLTNFYYQKWILETTPNDVLEKYHLQEYKIQFKGESLLGDTLIAQSQELEPGVFVHSIRKDDQEIASGWTRWILDVRR